MQTYNIYIIRNIINNKIYIGRTTKTLSKRWSVHKAHAKYDYKQKYCSYLYSSFKKYGIENFEFKPLDIAYSFKHMVFLESFYIKYYHSNEPRYGYNLTIDGYGEGREFISESTKQKHRIISHKNKRNRIGKYRGVCYSKDVGHKKRPWTTRIIINNKTYSKRFNSLERAAESYDIYSYNTYGDNCILNFPEKLEYYKKINYTKYIKWFIYRKVRKSAFKGVIPYKDKYTVYLNINKKIGINRKYFGGFCSEIEAAKKYDLYCYFYYRDKSMLNFPDELIFNENDVSLEISNLKEKILNNNNFSKKTSKYRYVQLHNKSWRYNLILNKKKYSKSSFLTEEEAAIEVDKICYFLTKNKELLNFPEKIIEYTEKDLMDAYNRSLNTTRKNDKTTSKYRGVFKRCKKWYASFKYKDILYKEPFLSEEQAAKFYDECSVKTLGLKAKTNFPIENYKHLLS